MRQIKTNARLARTIESVYETLTRLYGPIAPPALENPIDVLVRTILSQNTSDTNSDAAYLLLRRKFPAWKTLLNADTRSIARTIRRGGLGNIKAKRIRQAIAAIQQREGALSLDRLNKLAPDEALCYLTGLPGVGIKTACCVLLFAFGKPVMPVDTHVSRVARRLGWVDTDTDIDSIHEHLEQMIPEKKIFPMHLYMIRHGRSICRARNPLCGRCPLKRVCRNPDVHA